MATLDLRNVGKLSIFVLENKAWNFVLTTQAGAPVLTGAAARYVRIYNLATAPTVGTSIPIIVIQVPPTSSKEIQFSLGIAMSTGIAYSITALAPATDATVVTSRRCTINNWLELKKIL